MKFQKAGGGAGLALKLRFEAVCTKLPQDNEFSVTRAILLAKRVAVRYRVDIRQM